MNCSLGSYWEGDDRSDTDQDAGVPIFGGRWNHLRDVNGALEARSVRHLRQRLREEDFETSAEAVDCLLDVIAEARRIRPDLLA